MPMPPLRKLESIDDDALLDIRETSAFCAAGRTTIVRLANAGKFPQPIHLATRKHLWRAGDIKAFIRSKIEGGV